MSFIQSLIKYPKLYLSGFILISFFFIPGLVNLSINKDILSSYFDADHPKYSRYLQILDEFDHQDPLLLAIDGNDDNVEDLLFEIDGISEVVKAEPKIYLVYLSHNFNPQKTDLFQKINHYLKDKGYHLLGLPIIQYEIVNLINKTLKVLAPICAGLILILLYIFTRSLVLSILPIIVVLFSIIVTLGLAGFLGFSLTGMTMGIPQILLAIGVCDSLHIISSYKQTPHRIKQVLKKNLIPTFITSMTTSLSFITFAFSSVKAVSELGILCAFGSLVAWLFTFIFIGPCLTFLNFKKNKTLHFKLNSQVSVQLLEKFKYSILFGFMGLFVVGLWASSQLNVGLDVTKSFDSKMRISKDMMFFKEKYKISSLRTYFIDCNDINCMVQAGNIFKLKEFVEKLQNLEGVNKIQSQLDLYSVSGKELFGENFFWSYEQLDEISSLIELQSGHGVGLLSANKSKAQINVFLEESNLNWGMELDEKVKSLTTLKVESLSSPALIGLIEKEIIPQLIQSVSLTILGIAILLFILFKSFSTALLALIPNIATLLLTSIVFYMANISISISTMIVWCICMGVAVDDTIHFIYYYLKARREGKSIVENIQYIYNHIGRALVCTTIILVFGFGSAMFSDYRPSWEAGLTLSLAMIFALIADLILLPAILLINKPQREKI